MKDKKEKKDESKFPFFMKKKKGKKENKEETKEKNESYENRRLHAIIETVNRIVTESTITSAAAAQSRHINRPQSKSKGMTPQKKKSDNSNYINTK